MTGYRIGWTRCSATLVKLLTKLQEPLVSCASSFNQHAAAEALNGPQDCVLHMRNHYLERRNVALALLQKRNRASSYVPGGAFYLPVDITKSGESLMFCVCLLFFTHELIYYYLLL